MARFEDLEVWRLSRQLTKELGAIFYDQWFKNWSFQDQIMRAAVSIGNNIAEWFERSSKKEFAMFLRYAKWSCGEIRQMLYLAEDFNYLSSEGAEKYRGLCIELSVKIYRLYQSLKKVV